METAKKRNGTEPTLLLITSSVWQVSHAQNLNWTNNLTGLFAIHIVSNWAVLKLEYYDDT